ncbi:hypothetical protein LCGC14_2017910 [marine sediment metagenome]|uniref:Uncharacterized protein n=1 Tax=marine sediment metagenome TaxID=412755 RepID=A0A0F9FKW6_9ZZZZ
MADGIGPEIGIEGAKKGLGGLLAGPTVKGMGAGLFATWLLQKILQTGHETGMRNIQREGLRSQAEMITPENLYMQAAQPQAQEEESMARNALFQQLSGGVLGPQLAKGEYMIGGR